MPGGVKVSVAMATYNGARFLGEQLESIAAQSRPPDEIVIGDDGSTDETADVVSTFARESRMDVRFTRNEVRLGSSQNFVACMQRCRGDLVLLSDQDDVWLPVRVQRTVEVLDAHPDAAYVFSDGDLMDERGAPLVGRLWQRAYFGPSGIRAFRDRRGVDALLKTNVVTGATMGIRRDRLEAALPVADGWVHDGWLAMLLELLHGGVPIPEPLIRYRVHSAQQIGVIRTTPRALLALVDRHDAPFLRGQADAYRALHDRVARLTVRGAAEAAAKAKRKANLLDERAAFRERPIRGAAPLLRALLRGDYVRFGLGWRQAAFDAVGALVALLPGAR